MAVIPVQNAYDGLAEIEFASANGGGDTVVGGSRAGGHSLGTYLIVNNGHSSAQTVTVNGVATEIGDGDTAIIPVNAGQKGITRAVTYSGVTQLTIAAISIAP